MSDCSDMCGKKEFGVKDDTEVTDVGAPRDGRVLKVDSQFNKSGTAY